MATLVDSTYGTDRAGLVCAYAFTPGAPGHPIDGDDAKQWVSKRDAAGSTFLWLHFGLSNAASERWLRQHLMLPNAFYESLRENPSTRVEAVDDALVAVVHDLKFYVGEIGADATVTLCVDERMMVSARTTPLRAIDRLRAAVKAGARFDSPVGLLAHLLRDQSDVLVEIVRSATTEVDAIEDRMLGNVLSKARARLGLIRRQVVRVQRLLAPEPAALFRLLNRPPIWLREDALVDLRRSAEELSTAVADSTAVVERVRILQDELSAQLEEATSRTLFILTVLTAIVAPFEFISQLFGMGVGGVPFRDNPYGFAIVLFLILTVIGLGAVLVRRLMGRS